MKQYISGINIVSSNGYASTVAVANSIFIDLNSGNAIISLGLYKDYPTYTSGGQALQTYQVTVPSISVLPIYAEVEAVAVPAILADPNMAGGVLTQYNN